MTDKNKIIQNYSLITALASLVIGIYLLFYKINLHSDILYLDELFDDLLNKGGSWSDWKFSPAAGFLPDMLLYFIAYFIFPTASLRIYFVTISQVIIIITLILWLVKKIRPQISASAINLILLIYCFLCLVAFYSTASISIFFNSNNIQVPPFIFSLLLIGLFINFFEKPNFKQAFLIIILGGIAKASSAVFTLCFTVPALAALLCALLFFKLKNNKNYFKVTFLSLSVIALSHAFGVILEKLLIKNDPLAERLYFTKEAAYRSLKMFDDALKYIRNPDNLYTVAFSYFCFLVFVFLLICLVRFLFQLTKEHKLNIEDNFSINTRFKILIIFAIFSIPLSWAGAMISGGFHDLFGFRYFMLATCLVLIIAIIKLDIFLENKINYLNYFNLFFSLIIIILTLKALVFVKNEFKEKPLSYIAKYGAVERKELKIANCLINIEKNGVDLKSGIADFWYARGVRHYLPDQNYIIAVMNNLNPFFWISNIGTIARPENYPEIFYNFVILHQAYEIGQFDFTPKTIGNILPPQYIRHACDEANAEIWVYQGSELNDKVKAVFDKFNIANGFKKLSEFTADILNSATGKILGTSRVAEENIDEAGYITYGPYIALKKGDYKITVSYISENSDENYIEVGSFSSSEGNNILLKKTILNEKNTQQINEFNIPKNSKNIEFRTWYGGKGKLKVKSIKLKRI